MQQELESSEEIEYYYEDYDDESDLLTSTRSEQPSFLLDYYGCYSERAKPVTRKTVLQDLQ